MTKYEEELLEIIRGSKDPAKAITIAVDVICEYLMELRCQPIPLDSDKKS